MATPDQLRDLAARLRQLIDSDPLTGDGSTLRQAADALDEFQSFVVSVEAEVAPLRERVDTLAAQLNAQSSMLQNIMRERDEARDNLGTMCRAMKRIGV